MKAWLTHHLRAFKGTWLRFGRAPFATLFNIVVIGIALALPVALYTVIYNIQSWAQHLPADPQITLISTSDASRTDVADIEQRLKRRADVKKTVYVSRDQALEALTLCAAPNGYSVPTSGANSRSQPASARRR